MRRNRKKEETKRTEKGLKKRSNTVHNSPEYGYRETKTKTKTRKRKRGNWVRKKGFVKNGQPEPRGLYRLMRPFSFLYLYSFLLLCTSIPRIRIVSSCFALYTFMYIHTRTYILVCDIASVENFQSNAARVLTGEQLLLLSRK